MRAPKVLGALIAAAGTCVFGFGAASMLLDVWAGRTPRFQAIWFALPMAAMVTLVGLLVQWPLLRALHSSNSKLLIAVGALLALVPCGLLFGLMLLFFRHPTEDPATLAGFIRFWMRVPAEFLVPFVPMAAAGGVLGWFARERPAATVA